MRILLLLLMLAGSALAQPADAVRQWRSENELAIVREFRELLALPNVAADTPNIQRNAEHLLTMMRKRGIDARLLDGAGGPAPVYGELLVPGATRTLLFYAHYDGQPVIPAQWQSDPWTAMLRRGSALDSPSLPWEGLRAPLDPETRIYARGASDDKGAIMAMLAALDALRATGRQPDVNLKFFLEGEEEAGSPHLEQVLKQNAALLRADLMLFCDGPIHQSRRPQLFFGARGMTGVQLTVYGPARALHSGHYGNWAPNPAVELAHLVAGLRDTDGRVLIPGFYDGVRPLSPTEKQELAAMPPVEAELKQALAIGRTESQGRVMDSIMQPGLNVRGLESGAVGERTTNSIPVSAKVSIDLRLVPDQTPDGVRQAVERHLRARGYHLVSGEPDADTRRAHLRVLRVEWEGGYAAHRTSMDLPASQALIAAVRSRTGDKLLLAPMLGGSVPMSIFYRHLKMPIVGVPIANHDNNQHAANENLRLQNLWDGIELFAGIFAELGSSWK